MSDGLDLASRESDIERKILDVWEKSLIPTNDRAGSRHMGAGGGRLG